MWEDFLGWLQKYRVGDIASVIGVVISLIGFAVTIVSVFRSKRAAERAELAAKDARESIRLFEIVVDFTAAISTLEEIKRAHRHQKWELLPDRYAAIRKLLISLRSSSEDLSSGQRSAIQSALVNQRAIETAVERGLSNPSSLKPAKFNSVLSDDVDNLTAVLAELKTTKTGA